MLPLARLNYLLRHSGGNRTAGSADLRAPFQMLNAFSHWTHYQGRQGGSSVVLSAATQYLT